ncbi:transposase [Spirosoma fluminis]
MKAKSRRQFTSEFKVKVVLEVLRQGQTLSQIASDYDLHPQLVPTWKQAFIAATYQVFDQQKGQKSRLPIKQHHFTNRSDGSSRVVGAMELSWLKKNGAPTFSDAP